MKQLLAVLTMCAAVGADSYTFVSCDPVVETSVEVHVGGSHCSCRPSFLDDSDEWYWHHLPSGRWVIKYRTARFSTVSARWIFGPWAILYHPPCPVCVTHRKARVAPHCSCRPRHCRHPRPCHGEHVHVAECRHRTHVHGGHPRKTKTTIIHQPVRTHRTTTVRPSRPGHRRPVRAVPGRHGSTPESLRKTRSEHTRAAPAARQRGHEKRRSGPIDFAPSHGKRNNGVVKVKRARRPGSVKRTVIQRGTGR